MNSFSFQCDYPQEIEKNAVYAYFKKKENWSAKNCHALWITVPDRKHNAFILVKNFADWVTSVSQNNSTDFDANEVPKGKHWRGGEGGGRRIFRPDLIIISLSVPCGDGPWHLFSGILPDKGSGRGAHPRSLPRVPPPTPSRAFGGCALCRRGAWSNFPAHSSQAKNAWDDEMAAD